MMGETPGQGSRWFVNTNWSTAKFTFQVTGKAFEQINCGKQTGKNTTYFFCYDYLTNVLHVIYRQVIGTIRKSGASSRGNSSSNSVY